MAPAPVPVPLPVSRSRSRCRWRARAKAAALGGNPRGRGAAPRRVTWGGIGATGLLKEPRSAPPGGSTWGGAIWGGAAPGWGSRLCAACTGPRGCPLPACMGRGCPARSRGAGVALWTPLGCCCSCRGRCSAGCSRGACPGSAADGEGPAQAGAGGGVSAPFLLQNAGGTSLQKLLLLRGCTPQKQPQVRRLAAGSPSARPGANGTARTWEQRARPESALPGTQAVPAAHYGAALLSARLLAPERGRQSGAGPDSAARGRAQGCRSLRPFTPAASAPGPAVARGVLGAGSRELVWVPRAAPSRICWGWGGRSLGILQR